MNQPAREYMRGRALEGVALLQAGKPSASVALTPYELLSLLDAADDRDRLLADLAKAREELEAYSSQCDTPAADAGEFWRDLVDAEKERDEARAKFLALAAWPDERTDFLYRYVQPMSVGGAEDPASLRRCLAFLKEHPRWALSRQDHHYWSVA